MGIKKILEKFHLAKKKIPEIGEPSEDNTQEEPTEEVPEEKENMQSSDSKTLVELERLKARMEALDEMKKSDSERFGAISEQIGELRSMEFEKEKHIARLEAKATKAADLVNAVQPEKLMEDVMKFEAKIESIKGRTESNKAYSEGILEQLKTIKRTVSMFQDTEQILEMNKDVKNELLNMQKISGTVENRASKVESIFMEVQKNFSAFEKYASLSDDIKKSTVAVTEDVNDVKVKMNTLAGKEDLKKTNDVLGKELIEKEKAQKQITEVLKSNEVLKEGYKIVNEKFEQLKLIEDEFEILKSNIKKQDIKEKKNQEFESEILKEIGKLSKIINKKEETPVKIEKTNSNDLKNKLQGLRRMNEKDEITPISKYIKNTAKLGFSRPDITKELLKKGWGKEEIDHAYVSLSN